MFALVFFKKQLYGFIISVNQRVRESYLLYLGKKIFILIMWIILYFLIQKGLILPLFWTLSFAKLDTAKCRWSKYQNRSKHDKLCLYITLFHYFTSLIGRGPFQSRYWEVLFKLGAVQILTNLKKKYTRN